MKTGIRLAVTFPRCIPFDLGNTMVTVKMTSHLYRFFPGLKERTLEVSAGSVAEIMDHVNQIAPGFTDYVLDDHGALRRHVHLCIDDVVVIDKTTLSDRVKDESTLYIFQSLTGG